MSELAKKLGIKQGQRACLQQAGAGSSASVRSACQGIASLSETLDEEDYDLIFTWLLRLEALVVHFREPQSRIHLDGAIWVIMPKEKYAPGRGVRLHLG